MRKLSILIVEDDEPTLAVLKAAMEDLGHIARCARTQAEGFGILQGAAVDLLILDRGLPDGDGLKLCLDLKKDARYAGMPILMLTGKADTCEKVLGLRFGADDYLAKPFDMEELLARMDALVRRLSPGLAASSGRLVCGGVEMDVPAYRVTAGGKAVPLTRREFSLLRVLLERAGCELTREFLLAAAWPAGAPDRCDKTVDVTVMSLRRKLGRYGAGIESVRARGYKIVPLE